VWIHRSILEILLVGYKMDIPKVSGVVKPSRLIMDWMGAQARATNLVNIAGGDSNHV
jgi:hypothetical protein